MFNEWHERVAYILQDFKSSVASLACSLLYTWITMYNCTYYVVNVYYTYFHYALVVTNYKELQKKRIWQKTKFLGSNEWHKKK